MARSELIGSWYNSGFHGHYRSKSRSDFNNEYRNLAKPHPPGAFTKRSKDNPSTHLFSRHDNRHSFMNDALYFEEGLGRRRIKNNTNRYQNDLLMWNPEREEFQKATPKMSVYKVDYHALPAGDTLKQKIIRRPKTSFDDNRLNTTSYRYSHCKDNPNSETISAMSNNGLARTENRKQKASFISGRESVATCLNWYCPPRPKSSVFPNSTYTQTQPQETFIPHPPETQKTITIPVQTTPCTHVAAQDVTSE